MRDDYDLLYNAQRGAEVRQTVLPRFDLETWRRRGGDPERPPYFDEYRGKVCVFVDASIFPTFAEWQPQAALAIDAAIVTDRQESGGVMRGVSEILSPEPHFLVELAGKPVGGLFAWRYWINCGAADKYTFTATLQEAKSAAREREAIMRNGGTLAALQLDPKQTTRYASSLNAKAQDTELARLYRSMTGQQL